MRNILKNPNDVNKAAWKRFRNKTSETIKRAEELYYKKIIVVTIIVVRSSGKHLVKFLITIKSNIISLLTLKSMGKTKMTLKLFQTLLMISLVR